uniref:Reverse transcriptase domain-containing protein n=1 Tax=Maylandia zebra TaxID=106582 RepID=A0A3P9BKB5_9CICH
SVMVRGPASEVLMGCPRPRAWLLTPHLHPIPGDHQVDYLIQPSLLLEHQLYLSNRLSSVHLATSSSSAVPVCCGVPQGSVLGPTLFSLYMLPLSAIFEKYHIAFHYYADDIQIYFELNDDLALSLNCFRECMCEVKQWLLANTLILNDKKTEIVVFGSNVLRAKLLMISVTNVAYLQLWRPGLLNWRLGFAPFIHLT